MNGLVERMIVAFGEEMERQRAAHGWPAHPKPPFSEWPQEERDATVLVMVATLKAMREPSIAQRHVCTFEEAEITWPRMIDAAIQEHSNPTRQSS